MGATKNEGYHRNHYVPMWYQRRFLRPDMSEQKFHYLDLRPGYVEKGTRPVKRRELMHWGPVRCFVQEDLYTTRFGAFESVDIEKYFFGKVDSDAPAALDYFANFSHPSADGDAFRALLTYMSVQKLRTPKGLSMLKAMSGSPSQNALLLQLQRVSQMYCALWTECIWSIVDASASATKFIVSDHPVTVYNKGCFPGSKACAEFRDPEVWKTGTHTIFPFDLNRCLILTNLSWVRNCYGNPMRDRPHPELFRSAIIDFRHIQVGRSLAEGEVIEINHVIKSRAYRYVAAAEKEWLYPERRLGGVRWDRLGGGLLFMPDPRGVSYSTGVYMGFRDGSATAFDTYGRRPWHKDFDADAGVDEVEWNGLHAFQGEFARRFGRRRRGASFEFDRLETEDSEEYHRELLRNEGRCKSLMRTAARTRK